MKYFKKLSLLLLASGLSAEQFSFQMYNDFFAGADQHFTNGIAISWLDDTFSGNDTSNISTYSNLILELVDFVPFRNIQKNKRYNAGASISQIIATPINTKVNYPQYNDIPYAGYLALGIYLFEWTDTNFFESRMEVGVVGKESGAGMVQNAFHTIIGNDSSKGWKTQLGTSLVVNALFRHGEITWKSEANGYDMDWFNHYGTQIGNFTTDLFAGTMFRIGSNYVKNFNVHYPYLREEATLLQLTKKHKGFGWSYSIGLNGEALIYSHILDEAKNDGYKTDKKILNASVYMGVDVFYDAHKMTYFYQSQSQYTYQQDNPDTFGGFMYSYTF